MYFWLKNSFCPRIWFWMRESINHLLNQLIVDWLYVQIHSIHKTICKKCPDDQLLPAKFWSEGMGKDLGMAVNLLNQFIKK